MYYNEIGRAGRDGAHARCTLILTSEDITKYSGGMWTKDKDAQQQEQQLDAIRGVREFALNWPASAPRGLVLCRGARRSRGAWREGGARSGPRSGAVA